jgi:hypothetical protein
VGWFAIACLFGFLLYYGIWRQSLSAGSWTRAITIAGTTIVVAALAFAFAKIQTLSWDYATQGMLARIIFGGALGFGVGYVSDAQMHGAPLLVDRGRSTYMSIGLALVILAIAAPHLDRWLARLAGFKTAIVEVQLTNISTAHKAVVPDSRESFLADSALEILKDYESHIIEDVAYIQLFMLPDLTWQKKQGSSDPAQVEEQIKEYRDRLRRLKNLQQAFTDTLTPLAECLQDAIKGGLSVESARAIVRPITDDIQQIFILEEAASQNEEGRSRKITLARQNLQDSLSHLPVENYLNPGKCSSGDLQKLKALAQEIPPYTQKEYANLPQLYVATASLLLFVHSDELALKMLEQARPDPAFHDYTLPFLHSKIMFFFGEPVESYKPFLDQMIHTANETLSLIQRVKDRCSPSGCDSETNDSFRTLQLRAQRSKRVAMNSIAYGIAQDLASRITSAEALEPVAQEYADELVKAVKKGEGIADENEKDDTNDTIAFVTLVIEGRNSTRNMTKIRNAIASLKLIIAHQEQSMKDPQKLMKDPQNPEHVVSKSRRTILNTARAHLSSAQELLEE